MNNTHLNLYVLLAPSKGAHTNARNIIVSQLGTMAAKIFCIVILLKVTLCQRARVHTLELNIEFRVFRFHVQ